MIKIRAILFAFVVLLSTFIFASPAFSQKILIPMDLKQTDHLKVYSLAYRTLEKGINVEWPLNYRGGSFLVDYNSAIERELKV